MSELVWASCPVSEHDGRFLCRTVMAPKRRAASVAKAGGKKVKEEPEAQPKDAFTSAKEALLAAGPQLKGRKKVDEHCPLSSSGEVDH